MLEPIAGSPLPATLPDPARAVAIADPRAGTPSPYDAYLGSLSNAESRRTMQGCLDRIARHLLRDYTDLPAQPGRYINWGQLRYADTNQIRTWLLSIRNETGEPWTPAYINKHLTALRRVLKEAWRLEQMGGDDYQRAIDLKRHEGERLPPGRSVAQTETATLLAACLVGGTLIGVRDAAIIALLYATGGRRAELAGALIEHYDPGTRTLRIVGKRNKERELDLTEQAGRYLGRWLAKAGRRKGPIFCAIDKHSNLKTAPLTPKSIGEVLNRRRTQAELPPLTAHDFRRTLVGDLLDEGVDLSTVQQIAGHASPITTAGYDRRPRAARKAAMERLASRLPHPDDVTSNHPNA